jgi:3-phosphoshikimate 1-carboxyvinyltransferase
VSGIVGHLPDPYPVVPIGGRLDAEVTLPGSKSISNRALLVAALAAGTTRLAGVLVADDTEAMLACLQALGVAVRVGPVDDAGNVEVVVEGGGGRLPDGAVVLDARMAGTVARFLPPALALRSGTARLDGAPRLRERPLGPLVEALGALGVDLRAAGVPGHLPLLVTGAGSLTPGRGDDAPVTLALPGHISSQFISGLMIAAACRPGGLHIELTTPPVSRPYLAMTAAVLGAFGAAAQVGEHHVAVAGGGLVSPGRFAVEPDASAASYAFAAAALCGGRVRVRGLDRGSLQGDVGFVDVLAAMGADVVAGDGAIEVRGGAPLRAVDADFSDISDTAQTAAVVAACATGTTRLTGIGFIRAKETDRVGATVAELRRLGVDATEEDDAIVVRRPDGPWPGPSAPTVVATYDDHRMAMSFALLGLVRDGVAIADPGCVAKTFPGYWGFLDRLRASARSAAVGGRYGARPVRVIAIDGPAGSGKSTVGKALAARLGLTYLDTGAMYRGVTYAALRRGIDPDDTAAVALIVPGVELDVTAERVLVDGVDATIEIRGPEVTRAVSAVAANPAVRTELTRRMREWARARGGGVIEGRDIGSVVFPDAELKVYLDAPPDVRAARRSKEVTDLAYEQVAASIAERDARDQGRAHAPLVRADGAVAIDTGDRSVAEIVAAIGGLLDATGVPGGGAGTAEEGS